MKTPLISVGMPVYNGEKYIKEAIESVLNQTFGDFELIISDNASIDNTESICREFQKMDNRINYFRNAQNIGAAGNYNILTKKASCEFFRWHNADDLIAPKAHQLCYNTLMENPDAVLAYGKTILIDNEGKVIRNYDDNLDLREDEVHERYLNYMNNVGLTNVIYGLIRTKLLLKTSLFGNYLASDTNFMAELCLYGKFVEIEEPLFYRRMHEDASSWDRDDNELQKSFWDPSSSKFNHQLIKQDVAYYKAVIKSKIPFADRYHILKYLARRSYWRKAELWSDLIYPIKKK